MSIKNEQTGYKDLLIHRHSVVHHTLRIPHSPHPQGLCIKNPYPTTQIWSYPHIHSANSSSKNLSKIVN